MQIIDLMAKTFAEYTQGCSGDPQKALKAQSPQRITVSTDSHKVLFMPSRLQETTSIKIVSVPTKSGLSGLPATTLVLDEQTGSVKAVMNAAALTAVRTAAGSGLATRYYANPASKNLVVFGAGAQGRSHVDMMIAVCPTIKTIAIWNRGEERRLQLIQELKEAYPDRTFVSANEDLQAHVEQADIVCTCTNATDPVLFGAWLKPGVHVNCVGSYRMDMHEVDAETIKRAEVIVVDSVDACAHEAGELVKSSDPKDWVEMGRVVLEKRDTEQDRQKITLFKSVGISVQDSAISGLMVERAEQEKLGSYVQF
ncbi:uncharacterized protein B0P05DRAFT_565177 [Gilbertella persicaria]|uniref:uncharacterized protein n=1 Tax=Gilbertella persicaria TaxID=101096 RepID=UPI00221F9EB8|nr:uncharacterized protein B0P05DRAFT_565177 [Gilbertella persicaria]KAI8047815.1 hypothetical protein B0P05DRAFT_565177 [Gilbertella persicaria]